jgi:hypothetical protein
VANVQKTFNFEHAEVYANAMAEPKAHGAVVGGPGANVDAFYTPEGGLTAAWDAMIGQQKSAQEAMEELNPKLQKMLDEYWKKKGS